MYEATVGRSDEEPELSDREQQAVLAVMSILRDSTTCPDITRPEWTHITDAPGSEPDRLATVLLLHASNEIGGENTSTYFRVAPDRKRLEELKNPSRGDKQRLQAILGGLADLGPFAEQYALCQLAVSYYRGILQRGYYDEKSGKLKLKVDEIAELYDATSEIEHPILTRLAALQTQAPRSLRPHSLRAERLIRLMLRGLD
ncbi:MAG TPA: hypothetical protein VGG13_00195 [Candidatus Saccharimonadales bacterium]|jgi:hypothetical protein